MNEKIVYIFLDIDGVLNAPGDKIIQEMFEEKKLKMFIDFIRNYQSIIVLTSSRRFYQSDVAIIQDVFKDCFGFSLLNDRKLFKQRGKEIEFFIYEQKIKRYVIFDDVDGGISNINELNKHFVFVDYLTGITEIDIVKAKNILESL